MVKRNISGFTFIETIVALMFLSIFLAFSFIGVQKLFYTATMSWKRNQDVIKKHELITTHYRLLKEIAYPFWIKPKILTDSNQQIDIPFYEGIQSNTLRISFFNTKLTYTIVKSDETLWSYTFTDIKSVFFTAIPGLNDSVLGVTSDIVMMNNTAISATVWFADRYITTSIGSNE